MPKIRYKYYLLAVLTLVAAFNYLDRYILSLMLESIKQDLKLSDTQLGLLTGFAFAAFYALAGVPIARWADRGNRNTIVSLTTALWSVMLALSALVGNFVQLLLVRVGVAVGEAGCLPPAQSWIADYFDRSERPHAMAIYWMCTPIAMIIGYLGGGWLIDSLGWRTTFFVIGVPGVFLALLVKFTLPEPRLKQPPISAEAMPSFAEVISTLWQRRSFFHIVTAFLIAYLFGAGIAMWQPTFFMRSHGMSAAEVGAWMSLTNGVSGVVGTYLGGVICVRYAKNKEALHMKAIALSFVIASLLYAAAYLSSNKYIALACIATLTFLSGLIVAPVFSAIQSLVAERMRSVALALVFLLANFIGAGLGPLLAGMLSDLLVPLYGDDSLRFALVLLSPLYLWAAYHYWRAGKTIEADISTVELSAEKPRNRVFDTEINSMDKKSINLI